LELERKSRSFKEKAGNAESFKRGRGLDFKDVRLYVNQSVLCQDKSLYI
ncbi:hypothetical protein LEP1GSC170_0219, partial [Leptospira interrogans serovar Bataviae str. HAI135]